MVLICQDAYLMQIRVLHSFFNSWVFFFFAVSFLRFGGGGFFMLIATRQSFLLTVVPHGKFTMKSIGMIGF